MKFHDPYKPMLAELSDANEADTDALLRESLKLTQPFVKALREAYKSSPSQVDYSSPFNRAAYLLAYYPHYIESLYHILCSVPPSFFNDLFTRHNKPRACFFGAGPAPEVIGWISYLNEHVPQAESAVAYLLDKNIDGWHKAQEITRYHIAPLYWPAKKLITVPLEFDLLDAEKFWNARVERAVSISNFFVMQNCLNDQLHCPDEILRNFLWVFEKLCPGSMFVVADLDFRNILDCMLEVEDNIVQKNLGVVRRSAKAGLVEFDSQIETPRIITEELLTGGDGLIPRKHTKFHLTILERSLGDSAKLAEVDSTEIPF